jgi:low affinity Fe/Cu permease
MMRGMPESPGRLASGMVYVKWTDHPSLETLADTLIRSSASDNYRSRRQPGKAARASARRQNAQTVGPTFSHDVRGQKKQMATETQTKTTNEGFGGFAASASAWLGSKWAFAGAGAVIIIWIVTGPIFHYSDTWQLVINTGTSVATFLMVFLIQNTQNRDARAINLKLNELIRAIDSARDQMIDIESLSDLELDELHTRYEKVRTELLSRDKREESKENQASLPS